MPLISLKGAPRLEQEAPFLACKKAPGGGIGRRFRSADRVELGEKINRR
jgi:hypothetical protein